MKSSYSIVGNGSAGGGSGDSTVTATASFSSCASSSSSSSSTSSAITLAASSSSSSSTTTQTSMKNATTTTTNGNHQSTIDGDSEQCYSGAILYGHSRKSQMVKCVFVGDGAIGKTSLIVSYTTNGYPAEYVPTAFDTYSVVVTIDNKPCQLQLCDTAGQDDFDSIRPLCYKYTDVFMVCFSVVSPASFQNVRQKWLPELRKSIQNGQCSKTGKSCDSATSKTPPFILVGTQCDLRHDVKVLIELDSQGQQPIESDYARTMAKKFGAICYIECSALTQKNLKEVFDTAIISALDFQSQPKPTTKNHSNHNHQAIYIRSPAGSSNGHRTDHHHRNKQPDGNSQHNKASHKDSTSHNPSSLATGPNREITANQNHSNNKSKNRANISDARLVGWRKSLTKLSAQEALESESAQAMNRHNQNRNSTSNPTLPTSGDYCYSSSSSSSKTNSSTSCSESQSGLGLSVPVLAKSTYSPPTPRRHYPRNGQAASSASSSPIASTRALLHPTAFNPVASKPLILSQNHPHNNNNKKAHISKSRHKHQPNQLTSDPEDDQGFHDVEEEFDDSYVACDKMDNYDDRIQLSTAKSNCHYYYHQQQPQQPVSRVPPATPNSPGKSSRTSKQSSPSYYYYQNRPLPSQPSPYAQHQYHYSARPIQPVPAATTTTTSNYSHQYQPVYQSSRPQPSKLQSFFQHLTRPLSSSSGSSGTSISHPSKLLTTKPSNNPTITPTAHLQSTGPEPDHSRKPLFSNQTNLATTLRSSSFFFLSSNTFKKNKNLSNNKKKETNNKDLKSSVELSSSACSGSSSSSSSIVSNSLFKNSKNGSNQSYRSEIFQIMSNSVTELRNRKSLLKKFTSSYSSSSTSSSSNNEKSRLKSKKLKDLYYYDYEDDDDYEEIDTNDRRSKCLFSCCLPF